MLLMVFQLLAIKKKKSLIETALNGTLSFSEIKLLLLTQRTTVTKSFSYKSDGFKK